MPTVYSCPSCKKRMKIEDRYVGKKLRCPHCQQSFTINKPASVAPIPPPPPAPHLLTQEVESKPIPGTLASHFAKVGLGLYLACSLLLLALVFYFFINYKVPRSTYTAVKSFYEERSTFFGIWNGSIAISGVLFLFTGIGFIVWFYQVRTNIDIIGTRKYKNYNPVWAIIGFFIPIIYLYIPCMVALEIWRNSQPGDATETSTSSGKILVIVWWVVFIVAWHVGAFVSVVSMVRTRTIDMGFIQGFEIYMPSKLLLGLFTVTRLLSIASAALAFLLIIKINKNQTLRFAEFRATGNNPFDQQR